MKIQDDRRKVKLLISGLSLGLFMCALPTLAQGSSDNSGSGGSGSGTTSSSGTTQSGDTRRDNNFNPGWLGLLGLVGLAGLRRPQHSHDTVQAHPVGR